MRVVSTDKLAVQVLVAVMAGVAPPVEGLTVTNEVALPGTVSSQSSLSTPDTFAGLVTNISVISPCLKFSHVYSRFVAVKTVGGPLAKYEGDSVQSPLTEGAPEAGRVILSLLSPQDLLLDRQMAVMALGQRLLEDEIEGVQDGDHPPSSLWDRRTCHPVLDSNCCPAQLDTWNI